MYSSSIAFTAAMADCGGPQSATDDPMASQVLCARDGPGKIELFFRCWFFLAKFSDSLEMADEFYDFFHKTFS